MRVAADVSELKTNMEKATGFIETTAKALAGAWVVHKIYEAAAATVEFADRMHNLSIQTGIGVEALQELEYAARRSNTPFETITKAVNVLQEKLATGDKSAVAALRDMGVSFDAIKAKRPEDQFRMIMHAVEGIESPMDRVAVLGATFGDKIGPQLLPLASSLDELAQHFRDLGVVLDQDTIANLSSLDGTMVDLEYIGRAVMANVLVPMVPYLKDAASASGQWKDVLDGVVLVFDSFVWGGAKVVGTMAEIAIAGLKAEKFLEPWKNFDGVLDKQIAELQQVKDGAEQWAKATETVDRTQKGAAKSTHEHDDELRRLALSFGAAAEEAEAARARFQKVHDQEVAMFDEMRKAATKMSDEWRASVQKAAIETANVIVSQQLKLRELAEQSEASLSALYLQGATGLDAQLEALAKTHADKLTQLNIQTLNLTDENSRALVEKVRQNYDQEYERMFNDLVQKSAQFGDNVAGTIAAAEPKLAAASGAAAGSVQNNFLQIFGNIESRAGQMVDSVTGTLNALMMDDAYREAGFFVDNTGVDALNARRLAKRTSPALPHFAGGVSNFGGGFAVVGERGPEVVHLPGGSSVTPNGAMGNTFHLTINVAGGRQAADEIVGYLRAKGVRL